jgi:hypothetical protein
MTRKRLSPSAIGILLGSLYGIALRVLLELNWLKDLGGLVSLSFMFLVPFVIGYIRIYFELLSNPALSYGRMIVISWQPIFIFLAVSVITLLEGSICVAIALPAFLLFSSLGGVFAGLLNNFIKRRKQGIVYSISLFPLLFGFFESNFIHLSREYTVANSIEINASPAEVWSQLGNVKSIAPEEFKSTINSWIGIPRPVEASMNELAVGATRVSRWEKGIVFKEQITHWEPNKAMLYRFEFDPESIPATALDQHVKLGGEYFSPIDGGYRLIETDRGTTVLTLETRLRDNTNFGIYSRLWGEVVFRDFHNGLLKMMKKRSES